MEVRNLVMYNKLSRDILMGPDLFSFHLCSELHLVTFFRNVAFFTVSFSLLPMGSEKRRTGYPQRHCPQSASANVQWLTRVSATKPLVYRQFSVEPAPPLTPPPKLPALMGFCKMTNHQSVDNSLKYKARAMFIKNGFVNLVIKEHN